MEKLTAYIISVIGLVIAVLSFNIGTLLPESIKPAYVMIAGLVLVIMGIFFVLSKGSKQSAEEIPIYEGTGKKRKIIGYRKN